MATAEQQRDPAAISRIATGFTASEHLLVANEIGHFAALADGAATLEQLAERSSPRSSVCGRWRSRPERLRGAPSLTHAAPRASARPARRHGGLRVVTPGAFVP
ncbi:MAG: hypothetical protein QOK40_3271 [Miltoncostaeaceae bacterium]|jgi:hypothetical protein|nr:hypothetical protein [Miltoncostaeaceae bacterium]